MKRKNFVVAIIMQKNGGISIHPYQNHIWCFVFLHRFDSETSFHFIKKGQQIIGWSMCHNVFIHNVLNHFFRNCFSVKGTGK